MSEKEKMMYCATKLPRKTLQTLKNIAFDRHVTLKDLLQTILTEYANKHGVTV